MTAETLADALDLDEHAPERHRLWVCAMALADASLPWGHRCGAIDHTLNRILRRTTPTEKTSV